MLFFHHFKPMCKVLSDVMAGHCVKEGARFALNRRRALFLDSDVLIFNGYRIVIGIRLNSDFFGFQGKEGVVLPEKVRETGVGVSHVLVTGGAGYVGSHAALRLLEDGHNVTVVDDLSRGNLGAIKILQEVAKPGQFEFIKANLTDLEELHGIFARNSFDAVMHFAAYTFIEESFNEPLMYYQINTGNIVNILDAMRVHNVSKFVYSSSSETYGDHESMPITEETLQVPVNPYGLSKRMAEEIIKDYSNSNNLFSAAILRYFNVVGSDPGCRLGEEPLPLLRMYSRLTTTCVDAALGRIPSIQIHGTNYPTEDGTCIRDYIHVSDLVSAHIAAMKHLVPGQVQAFNVGTGRGHSVREFVAAWKKVTGKAIKVEEIKDVRTGELPEVYCDPSKAEKELGWKAQYVDLEAALATTWRWHQANPNGYSSPL